MDMAGKEPTAAAYTTRELTDDELDALSARLPEGNFQQTSMMRRLASRHGAAVDVVGVVDADDTPLAGAMIVVTPSRFGHEGSVWQGPLCDPHDRPLMAALTDAIRRAAARRGAYSVTCWPYDVYRRHRSDGTADGEPDETMMATYAALGWRHHGFDVGYGSLINRWSYVKDLHGIGDEKSLLDSYAKNTRRNVKIARNSAVEVERIGRDRLATFHAICELSCEKQGFRNRSLAYFEDLYDTFGESAEFLVASIDMRAYLASWERKRDGFLKDIDRLERSLDTTRYPDAVDRKLDTARSTYEASLRRVEQAHAYLAEDGERVPVAAALFVWHRRECVYLFSGSNEKYAKFYAPTAIQHHAMMQCLERGMERYNFYGISGVFDDPDDPGRGVLEFKQGFDGYVEELPGAFTLPVDRVRCALADTAHRLLHR